MTKVQPILDELHSIREQLLADSGGTLEGLVSRLQKEQEASGRIIRETRRTKRSSGVATDGVSVINVDRPQLG